MKTTFSEYLQRLREKYELTQQEMIERLIMFDESFEKLDITTYSRWERGATVPKLTKQIMVARAFKEDMAVLVESLLNEGDAKIQAMGSFLGAVDYPYWLGDYEFTPNLHIKSSTILARILAFHRNYLSLDISTELLLHKNIKLDVHEDAAGYLIGHLLHTFTPLNSSSEEHDMERLTDIALLDLENNNGEPINIYIISSYSSVPDFRLSVLLHVIDLCKKHPEIKYLITNCHQQRNYNIYDMHTECEVIGKGPLIEEGGVKVFGKRYSYVRLKIKAETILSAKVNTHLIPYGREL